MYCLAVAVMYVICLYTRLMHMLLNYLGLDWRTIKTRGGIARMDDNGLRCRHWRTVHCGPLYGGNETFSRVKPLVLLQILLHLFSSSTYSTERCHAVSRHFSTLSKVLRQKAVSSSWLSGRRSASIFSSSPVLEVRWRHWSKHKTAPPCWRYTLYDQRGS